jgi:hypothetical protein
MPGWGAGLKSQTNILTKIQSYGILVLKVRKDMIVDFAGKNGLGENRREKELD